MACISGRGAGLGRCARSTSEQQQQPELGRQLKMRALLTLAIQAGVLFGSLNYGGAWGNGFLSEKSEI